MNSSKVCRHTSGNDLGVICDSSINDTCMFPYTVWGAGSISHSASDDIADIPEAYENQVLLGTLSLLNTKSSAVP